VQTAPGAAHWQAPFAQLPEQQSAPVEQTAPAPEQVHVPPVQVPEQQSAPVVHATPGAVQAQVPSTQLPEQHRPSPSQTPPVGAHAHVPSSQLPAQQSLVVAHAAPDAAHVQVAPSLWKSPEQQWALLPSPVNPGGRQHVAAAPHSWPVSHWTFDWQDTPAAELQVSAHWVESFGSHCCEAAPEQHAVCIGVGPPPLVQVHTPFVHAPVSQSLFSAQAAPVVNGAVQIPAAQ
jgi:hypothetical protein